MGKRQDIIDEFANQIIASRTTAAVPRLDNAGASTRLAQAQVGRIKKVAEHAVKSVKRSEGEEHPTADQDEIDAMAVEIAGAIHRAAVEQVAVDGRTKGLLGG